MKLFYRKSGDGKPLIILHGILGMSDNWMTLSKQFAEAGFLVYAVDARNHGRSPWADEFNYGVMAEDILELIVGDNLKQASVIGHSMGGKTAMFLACQHPEKISKLIVADKSPKEYPIENKSVIEALESIDISSIKSRKEVESNLRESLNEATVQFLLKNLYWVTGASGEQQLAWRFNSEVIKRNVLKMGEALPNNFHFNGPTLFLKGERSPYVTDGDTELIKNHFPNAIIETVPKAGHWIHSENPTYFMEAALRFLNF